jgi:hypothetical protein
LFLLKQGIESSFEYSRTAFEQLGRLLAGDPTKPDEPPALSLAGSVLGVPGLTSLAELIADFAPEKLGEVLVALKLLAASAVCVSR